MDTAPNSCSVGNNVAGTLQSVRVHRAPAAYRIIRPVITDQDFDFVVGADRCDGLLNIARPTLMRDRVRSLCYEWLRFLIGPLWRKTVFARHGVALRWGRHPGLCRNARLTAFSKWGSRLSCCADFVCSECCRNYPARCLCRRQYRAADPG